MAETGKISFAAIAGNCVLDERVSARRASSKGVAVWYNRGIEIGAQRARLFTTITRQAGDSAIHVRGNV